MRTIRVLLPVDRDYAGTLTVEDEDGRRIAGPCAVSGRADGAAAADHGNPSRSPLLPYGDTPNGRYRVTRVFASGEGSYPAAEFGPHGLILIEPASGDAALADASGRFSLLIQGGDATPTGTLRATNGALRLANPDQKLVVDALRGIRQATCEVAIASTNGAKVDSDSACDNGDPAVHPIRARAEWITAGMPVAVSADIVAFGEYSGDDGPGDDGPGDDGPGDDGPGDDEPGDDEPGDDEPGDDEPGDDEPGGDEPGDDEPGDDQPGDDEPEGVDDDFISEQEGGARTDAYIVEGSTNSGVTVGTGVDLGHQNLDDLDISDELKEKLAPYEGLTGDEAKDFLGDNPLELTPDEVRELDHAVQGEIRGSVSSTFDEESETQFSDLPSEAQTVIMDVAHQYGPNLAQRTPNFWGAVTEGRWSDAVAELRDFGDNFSTRRNAEADLLQKAIDDGRLKDR